jgi:hypothetical protein
VVLELKFIYEFSAIGRKYWVVELAYDTFKFAPVKSLVDAGMEAPRVVQICLVLHCRNAFTFV